MGAPLTPRRPLGPAPGGGDMLPLMDLRDRFAAQFAAALVDAFTDADQLARRAYDLAEAMLTERARRIDGDELSAIAYEPRRRSLAAPPLEFHGALLDEPEPMMEPELGPDDDVNPLWLEPPYDPSWDLEARWSSEPPSRGPGLARTQPEEEEAARKERLG
jgi:hypothetical protein